MSGVWGAVGGAVGGLVAGRRNWRWRRQERRKANRFTQHMSNTAHQREVKDLRAAGLNPILSSTGGPGASSPMGQMAHPPQPFVTDAISTGMQAMKTGSEVDKIKQEITNLEVAELLTDKQVQQVAENTRLLIEKANLVSKQQYAKGLENLALEQRTQLFRSHEWLQEIKAVSDSIGLEARDLTNILKGLLGRIKLTQ